MTNLRAIQDLLWKEGLFFTAVIIQAAAERIEVDGEKIKELESW